MRFFYVWASAMGAMGLLIAEVQGTWKGWTLPTAVVFMVTSMIAVYEFDKADRRLNDRLDKLAASREHVGS
jgi:hypothetical protein